MIETLTQQQKISLINGDVVGFFKTLILSTDSFYNSLHDLCLTYYMSRSGEKPISVTYERLLEIAQNTPNESADDLLGKLIRGKFIDKWLKVYDTLVTTQYNVLNNREYTEDKTGDNVNKDTYNTNTENTGSDTNITTFDTNVEDNGKTSIEEKTTRTVNTNDDVYGFNSTSPVGDSETNETEEEVVSGDADKNTTHNLQSKTGTEDRNNTFSENKKHTGTDTRDITIREKTTKTGREGSGAELITEELNLRNSQIFFDIIYSDIDSIATLQIYI